jgi:hypothetical protein
MWFFSHSSPVLPSRGHFLLENQLDTATAYIRGLLGRTLT